MNLQLQILPGGSWNAKAEHDSDDSDEEAVGGLFKMKTQAKNLENRVMHERDCSKVLVEDPRDWQELLADIKDCFVTGKWSEAEDAETLLQLDDQDDGRFAQENMVRNLRRNFSTVNISVSAFLAIYLPLILGDF